MPTDTTDLAQHIFETQLIDEAASGTGGRLPYELLLKERALLLRQSYIAAADGATNPILFFNQQRQMVHANAAAISAFLRKSIDEAVGLRLGELFGCDHKMSSKPGEVYVCQDCNSMSSLRTALQGRQSSETRFLVMHPKDRPVRAIYRVSAVPVSADDDCMAMLIFEKVDDASVK
jgi:hypothetical protein